MISKNSCQCSRLVVKILNNGVDLASRTENTRHLQDCKPFYSLSLVMDPPNWINRQSENYRTTGMAPLPLRLPAKGTESCQNLEWPGGKLLEGPNRSLVPAVRDRCTTQPKVDQPSRKWCTGCLLAAVVVHCSIIPSHNPMNNQLSIRRSFFPTLEGQLPTGRRMASFLHLHVVCNYNVRQHDLESVGC